ncbi:hypothetical protein [Hymenobacter glaciei]
MSQSAKKEVDMPSVSTQRPVRPFRPVPTPGAHQDAAFAPAEPSAELPPINAPVETTAVPVQPIQSVATAPIGAPATAPATPNPDGYIAAAIHAQHLQHQLALAELRNQHLLEQQQMLREMLAMARQGMV